VSRKKRDQNVGNTARGQKTLITDLEELKQRLRTEWAKLDHVVIAPAIIIEVVSSSRSVTRVSTPSLAVFPTRSNYVNSNLANFEATVKVG